MAEKDKFILEFTIDTPIKTLFEYISQPYRLKRWFADDVQVKGEEYVFRWEKSESRHSKADIKKNKLVKFTWNDSKDQEYLEFRIENNEITEDIALLITDFAPSEELDDQKLLWDNHIDRLKELLGNS